MSTKDISDAQVIRAYLITKLMGRWPNDILAEMTGECFKVCEQAMERAVRRGYIDYGVSLRTGWVTPKGDWLMRETTPV
jgi:hypothetical protein